MIHIIKLGKYIYINPLTILLCIFCFITQRLETLIITYVIMIIHELAHLIAAVSIGLKPSYISLQPFGVNLRLKNKIVYSIADEIILYISGPLVNVIFALLAVALNAYFNNIYIEDFYIKNIALFCMNMLPILPLDGGVIMKKIMMHKLGFSKGQSLMRIISIFFIIIICIFGIYLAKINKFNFSVVFLIVFMFGNVLTQKEKYNTDFIKELMFYKEKGIRYDKKNIKFLTANASDDLRSIAKRFNVHDFFVVFKIDSTGKIDEILTQIQILDKIAGG